MVHINAQHFTFRCKLTVNFCHVIVTVSHEHAQKFEVAAADEVACRKCVPEQMRVQPLYSGFFFQFCEKMLYCISRYRFAGTQGQEIGRAHV